MHRFEARLRDRFLADRAYAIRALPHASECFFDGDEETTVAFMQMDLKLRFRIGIGLVTISPSRPPAAGTGAKSSLWIADNSRCFAVNNLWYRCNCMGP